LEADPSRTVNVMPPVTGRVFELKVQLGRRVVQGQELAVIDSGDLAQAYSDIEKARFTLALTKKALDRKWVPGKSRRSSHQRPRVRTIFAPIRKRQLPAESQERRCRSLWVLVSGVGVMRYRS
jgi:multidrug resistance efflux pump